jgi:hypothetical protein
VVEALYVDLGRSVTSSISALMSDNLCRLHVPIPRIWRRFSRHWNAHGLLQHDGGSSCFSGRRRILPEGVGLDVFGALCDRQRGDVHIGHCKQHRFLIAPQVCNTITHLVCNEGLWCIQLGHSFVSGSGSLGRVHVSRRASQTNNLRRDCVRCCLTMRMEEFRENYRILVPDPFRLAGTGGEETAYRRVGHATAATAYQGMACFRESGIPSFPTSLLFSEC